MEINLFIGVTSSRRSDWHRNAARVIRVWMRHPRVDTTQGGATCYSFINKLLQIFYECVAYIRFQTRLIMASGYFCLSEGQNSIPFVKVSVVYVRYRL